VAGLVLKEWVESLGAIELRLRWPNDLLVGDRKLAGILVDRFNPNTLVLGIGLNVQNHPETADQSLRRTVVRLADCVPAVPALPELTASLLRRLGSEWKGLVEGGSALPLKRLNACWGSPRHVELDLDGRLVRGLFAGVDEQGRIVLQATDSSIAFYGAHQVRHLSEIEIESEP
jgi:BirA family biotin operon repressor/biotin-[acetyl-CoA-carboxylase] ligase